MPFKEGHEKIAGRQAGTQNKTTRDVKEFIQKIIDSYTDNDIEKLSAWSKTKGMATMFQLLGKIAPKKLTVDGEIKNKLLEKLDDYDKDNTDISNNK